MPAGVDEVFAPHFAALGGERVLGEPISEAFPLEDEGLTVQYFQNLRLEYETGQPQSVRVSPLGTWGYEGLREVVPNEVDENGRSRNPERQRRQRRSQALQPVNKRWLRHLQNNRVVDPQQTDWHTIARLVF